MEEGNIFDQMKLSAEKKENQEEEEVTMSKLDFEQLINDLKIKHRAEIDAIMLEQGIYKRIIQ